jgi:hypothetical protein
VAENGLKAEMCSHLSIRVISDERGAKTTDREYVHHKTHVESGSKSIFTCWLVKVGKTKQM